ncbi:hypothetical protein GCM10011531_07700 [Aquaticitalea lipolytica]|uniref:Uncharacterized protein n=1 Tax=Aquaticitalea lipolytica TaxID=1247562 RepID=A0A8J2TPK1_9FLAO|nr:hypothetical protein GCM10011531_07700 [Aquaticitalea lipolytica]
MAILNKIGLLTPESNKKDNSTPLTSTGKTIKLSINLNLILSDVDLGILKLLCEKQKMDISNNSKKSVFCFIILNDYCNV